MKSIITQIILLFTFLPYIGYSQVQSLSQTMQKYEPYISQLNLSYGVLEQKDGRTEFTSIGKSSITKHSVFNIGSATKKLTAILILQELERGSLQLTDSIGKYLQPIKNVDGSLSISDLLRHRSGLGEIVGQNFEIDFFAKSDSIYNSNFLENIPPSNPDMVSKYEYCNTNYILLGHLLEYITDQSYQDLLRERIFEPCQMDNTTAYISKSTPNLVPPTHMGQDVSQYLDYRFFYRYAFSAGSVASTLHDMALFYNHLFHKNTLLTSNSLSLLIDFDDADYGLGIQKHDNGFIGHGGNNIGYSYREYYNPDNKNMILIFTNNMELPLFQQIKQDAFNHLNDSPSNVLLNDQVSQEYSTMLGDYLFDEQGMQLEIQLKEENGYLYMNVQGKDLLLVSFEEGTLQSALHGITLKINPETKDELIFKQGPLQTSIKRIKA